MLCYFQERMWYKMKQIFLLTKSILKRTFRKKSNIITFILLPLLAVFIALFLNASGNSYSKIGVVDLNESYLSKDMIKSIDAKKKCSLVKIDDENVLKVLEDVNLGEKSPYEIIPLYMSLEECPIHNFGVFLRRKDNKLPYLLFGVQGGMDASHALTRGIMEAASISYGAYFNAIYNKDMLNNVIKDDQLCCS
ncbi:streptolysin S biosynthesis protein D (SagD) [Clostridium botulinum H04402 065]|nr:streptolysin S biosynthesis protein D (SagD) [Clostridium botulinum H04402 065]